MAIYFISDGEFVKIGKSYDPEKRLHGIQTGNPKKLTILKTIKEAGEEGGIYTEVGLHEKFSSYRVNGEWFEYSDEIKAFINDLDNGKTKSKKPHKPKKRKIKEYKEDINSFVYVDFNKRKLSKYEIGVLNAKAKRLDTDIVKVANSLGLSNKALNQEEAKLISDVLNELLDVKPIKRPNYKYYNFINTKGKLRR